MADENAGWSLTESDPSVFTALLTGLGVQGLQVEDLWSLEDDALAGLGQVKAFIFLFKYIGGIEESQKKGTPDNAFPGYFAHQVINNACATLAILNSVFNLPQEGEGEDKFALGPELENLKEFGQGMDSTTLGLTISNSDKIREVHNSFARSDPFSIDSAGSSEKEDAYHFISYLPAYGQLYELDGLQSVPRQHGAVAEGPKGTEWVTRAREVIQERIASYPPGALHFSLLAVTKDPLPGLKRELEDTKAKGDEMAAAGVVGKIEDEESKRKRWAFENSLRKHNHISFAHQLLLGLAKAGKLNEAVEAARIKGKARKEAARARGGDEEME